MTAPFWLSKYPPFAKRMSAGGMIKHNSMYLQLYDTFLIES